MKFVDPELVDELSMPSDPTFKVTMKRHASGLDHNEALQAALGEGYNARHTYTRYCTYLACMLTVSTNWPDPAKDGLEPLRLTPALLGQLSDERDVQFLLGEAASRVELRSAEQQKNSSATSSPSSEEKTGSRRRKSSVASSSN